jgi:hypothetical protein
VQAATTSVSGTRQSIEYWGSFTTIPARPVASARAAARRISEADHSEVQHLALAHEVVEGPKGLVERRGRVEPVGEVDVEVIGAEPAQRGLAGTHEVLARQARLVGSGTRGPVGLGDDLDAIAPSAGESATEHLLRPPVRIQVGGVEGGDPGVEGRMNGGNGRRVVDLGAVRGPVAEDELADEEAARPETAVLHA